jgi:Kef-type K+ transport system membrane component KefB
MTLAIIIIICSLLLIAYLFDLTSSKTKIPAIILLLIVGWAVRQLSFIFEINIPDLTFILPVLGTLGLILIVLEGTLELELSESRTSTVKKSFILALLPMLIMTTVLAYLFYYFGQYSFKNSIINAIPFCIISSAIAIPSVNNLSKTNKEFIVYETSLSDIIGVLLFNFIALNETIDTSSFFNFIIQILLIIVISFISTLGLSYLLRKIDHHIKFVPIILLVILIYAISKVFHLPALIFIVLFGLFLGNIYMIKKLKWIMKFDWIKKFEPDNLHQEAHKFKDIVLEFSFLIRALFFLLFGYLIETSEIMNFESIIWASVITALLYSIRYIAIKLIKLPASPLFYIAPRGLITILLFLSITTTQNIAIVNKSLIIQVIIITVFMMMIGIIKSPKIE